MAIVDEHKTAMNGDGRETGVTRASFSPDQQQKVQELIDEAYRKAYQKASREMVSRTDVERLETELGSMREERKVAAILRSLSRHNVVDPTEVADAIRHYVMEGDNGAIMARGPLGRDGRQASAAMTIDEYVDAWLSERPHHLRMQGFTGSGGSGSRFSGGRKRYNLSDPSAWRSMPREDLDRILREGVSITGASGQVFQFKDVKNPFIEARKRKHKGG